MLVMLPQQAGHSALACILSAATAGCSAVHCVHLAGKGFGMMQYGAVLSRTRCLIVGWHGSGVGRLGF